jgi:two-component system sensor histidine kinase DctS
MLASPRGRRTLRVRTSVDAGQVRLDVADSGPGFSAGAERDLFAPFFTTKPDGLGMGLSISRCLIERRQGRIWAEAGVGGGAVVRFSLPLFRTTASIDGRPAYRVCG